MKRRVWLLLVLLLVGCRSGATAVPPAATKATGAVGVAQSVAQTDVAVKGRLLYVQAGQMWLHSGTQSQPLDLGGAVGEGVWSHDGTRIAFVRRGESFADLYIVTITSRQVVRVTYNDSKAQPRTRDYVHQTLWSAQPTWSKDDSEIIFAGQPAPATTEAAANPIYEYPFMLYRYPLKLLGQREPNNTDELPITSDSDLQSPAWSPDGTTVAYVEAPRQQGQRQIMRYNFQDQTATPFPGVPSNAYDPAWSPDGNWLAFAAPENGATDIWVVAKSGGNPQRITKLGGARAPAWSPDGTQLACLNVGNDSTDVFVLDLKRNDTTVTAGPARALTQGSQVDATAGLSWGK